MSWRSDNDKDGEPEGSVRASYFSHLRYNCLEVVYSHC